MSDRADFVLTGNGNLIKLARFSSLAEFDLSEFFPYLNWGKFKGNRKMLEISRNSS